MQEILVCFFVGVHAFIHVNHQTVTSELRYLVLFIKLQKESSLALRFKFYLAIKLKLTSTYNSHKPKFGLQSYTNLTNKIFHCSLNTKQQIELIQTSPFLSVRRLHIEN